MVHPYPVPIAIGSYRDPQGGLSDYQRFSYPPWGAGGLKNDFFNSPVTF
jgi:hypothetical protein